jgi:hypothetical protein
MKRTDECVCPPDDIKQNANNLQECPPDEGRVSEESHDMPSGVTGSRTYINVLLTLKSVGIAAEVLQGLTYPSAIEMLDKMQSEGMQVTASLVYYPTRSSWFTFMYLFMHIKSR